MAGTLSRRNFLSLDFGDRRATGANWVRVHRIAMACRFEVMVSSDDAIDVEAARAALDEVDAVESMLTVHGNTSEVAALNRRAAHEPVAVSDDLLAMLARTADLHARTRGTFDITAAPLGRAWGFFTRDGRAPEPDEIERARGVTGMAHVRIDAERGRVSFDRPGVEVSFGAIGKGYALDRMADVLRRHAARRALLSAGHSSVLAIGGRGRGWPVDVRPRPSGRSAGRLWIRNGAVGTSGAGEQFVIVDGKRYGHVIDPRSGRPADAALAATVVARDAASADALSTAFLIGGAPLAHAYCSTHPDTMAILVLGDPDDPVQVFGRYDGATLES